MAKAVEQNAEYAPEQPYMHEKAWAEKTWEAIREFAASGFFKGALITAAVVMGVMGIVAGAMGAGAITGFAVSGIPVVTFEAGVAHGLDKGWEFLTRSVLGWATVAAGGAVGAYISTRKNQANERNAAEHDRHARLLELTQGVEQQQAVEKSETPACENKLEAEPAAQLQPAIVEHHHHHYHSERNTHEVEKTHIQQTQLYAAERTQEMQGKDKQDSIYLANSTVKGQGFSATELKRRIERETTGDIKTV